MSSEFKPCPFCGQEVKLSSKPSDWGYTSDTISIRCNDCGIGFVEKTQEWKPPPVGTYSIYEEALKTLKYKWNMREERRADEGTGLH